MPNIDVSIDFDDAVKAQCKELVSYYRRGRCDEEVFDWCFQLLYCLPVDEMNAVIAKLISHSSSEKEVLINLKPITESIPELCYALLENQSDKSIELILIEIIKKYGLQKEICDSLVVEDVIT